MSAARRPPRSDPQNSHDFRPRATQRNPRSAALFDMHTRPSSRNSVKACHRFSMYWIAFDEVVPARQFRRLLAHIGHEIVDPGPAYGASDRQALLSAFAVDRPLDRKQRVDPAHHLDGDRRVRDLRLSGSLAARVLLDAAWRSRDAGHAPSTPPPGSGRACGLRDERTPSEVRLEDARAGEMRLAGARLADRASNGRLRPAARPAARLCRRGRRSRAVRSRSLGLSPAPARSCHRRASARPPGHGPRRGAGSGSSAEQAAPTASAMRRQRDRRALRAHRARPACSAAGADRTFRPRSSASRLGARPSPRDHVDLQPAPGRSPRSPAGELSRTVSITFHAPGRHLEHLASRPRRACAGGCRHSTRKPSADRSPPVRAADDRGTCLARRGGE